MADNVTAGIGIHWDPDDEAWLVTYRGRMKLVEREPYRFANGALLRVAAYLRPDGSWAPAYPPVLERLLADLRSPGPQRERAWMAMDPMPWVRET